MSDGDGENGIEKLVDGDAYGRILAEIAVAQICESVGFQCTQKPALEILSEVAIRYVRDWGRTAHFYANLAGRTECNVVDVVQALEDLVSGKLFPGASDVCSWVRESKTAGEIKKFVSLEEVPFARDVSRFPVINGQKPTPSFVQVGEKPEGKHIPDWLPAFPDPHTYLHTPIWNERTSDPRNDKMEQARQRRKAERSLFSLQQRLARDGSPSSTSVDIIGDGEVKQVAESLGFAPLLQVKENGNVNKAAESNQFHAQPLQLGEEDVFPAVPPAKISNKMLVIDRNSVMEIFAPAIEKATIDSIDDDRNVLPNKRAVVNFRLGKKSLGVPLDLTLQRRIVKETAHLVGRGDDKDDKKRRAEQILKYSIENSGELVQL